MKYLVKSSARNDNFPISVTEIIHNQSYKRAASESSAWRMYVHTFPYRAANKVYNCVISERLLEHSRETERVECKLDAGNARIVCHANIFRRVRGKAEWWFERKKEGDTGRGLF